MKYPINNGKLASAIAIGCALAAAPAVQAMDVGQYDPPSLEGYEYEGHNFTDNDHEPDGIKESRRDYYSNPSGERILKVTCNDATYAWVHAEDPTDLENVSSNYVIFDGDGDGVFDQRFRLNEEYFLPDHCK